MPDAARTAANRAWRWHTAGRASRLARRARTSAIAALAAMPSASGTVTGCARDVRAWGGGAGKALSQDRNSAAILSAPGPRKGVGWFIAGRHRYADQHRPAGPVAPWNALPPAALGGNRAPRPDRWTHEIDGESRG